MEGGGEPAEITRIKSELQAIAVSSEQSGSWLASAMEASWAMAEALLAYPQLADLLGERHRIIGNNWQNACTAQLIARYLRRAVTVMERVDFSPAALRKDLAGARSAPGYLYAAAELINHAADLSAASSVLTHEDERRWRIFHERIEQITAPATSNDETRRSPNWASKMAGNKLGIISARHGSAQLCSAHLCAGVTCGIVMVTWWWG